MLVFSQLAAAPQRPFSKCQRHAKPKPFTRAEVLYDYQASDSDEISLSAGEKLSILKEGMNFSANFYTYNQNRYYFSGNYYFMDKQIILIALNQFSDESGWWTGRLPNGQEGFFPGAYVRKI